MTYRSLRQCVVDLAAAGHLIECTDSVDAHLEAAEIQRRVFESGGPAILFSDVRGCEFPMLANLFGRLDRAEFLFRDTLAGVHQLIATAADPGHALKRPWQLLRAAPLALAMRPKFVRRGPVLDHQTQVDKLPQQVSWPADGGAFITLPQVYTEDVRRPGWQRSNLGMYRVQLSGGEYEPNREIGLHYQIHRHIGVHHRAALDAGEAFRVNIFVGGPPAMTLAAVMPLPEGMSELGFAGALNRRRVRLISKGHPLPIHAEADFCLSGIVLPEKMLPEGPFGDHLGYYSLAHDFPVMRVDGVYHRTGAIWPMTVVGRPPQEDTAFGQLIHELTGQMIPTVLPGVRAVHAVDAAGVHPLLLAVGSERYTPYRSTDRPQEILTQASAILGQGQLSLAKYLLIANGNQEPELKPHLIESFFDFVLARADWTRDLHFHTQTTIDTLDYSGHGFQGGSKLVVAASGPQRFERIDHVPGELSLPEGFSDPRLAIPGVLTVTAPPLPRQQIDGRVHAVGDYFDLPTDVDHPSERSPSNPDLTRFCAAMTGNSQAARFRWIVLVDDSEFAARNIRNFLWVTFTRSNPAADVSGVEAFYVEHHWGCRGPLVIDARIKPHHAPPLVADPAVSARVDALAARGGPLRAYL